MAKIINVPRWMMPFGDGLTIYKLALVKSSLKGWDRDYTIAHELCHVTQWTTIGFFKFPILYIVELVKNGYKNNKYEIEARQYGNEKAKSWREACCGS